MGVSDYFQPKTLVEAIEIAQVYAESVFFAGGTDLMVAINESLIKPQSIIDISRIQELKFIDVEQNILRIGSLITMAELADSKAVRNNATALSEAAGKAAGPQVRNMGTIGGNLGTASPAGDLISPLMAFGASIKIVDIEGEKDIPIETFLVGPKKNVLKKDQLIKEIIIPLIPTNCSSAFEKIGKRKQMTISIANAACVITLNDKKDTFEIVRVAVGSLAPTVVRLKIFESALTGKTATAEEIAKYANLVQEDIHPITDARATSWYRKETTFPLVKNSLIRALDVLRRDEK